MAVGLGFKGEATWRRWMLCRAPGLGVITSRVALQVREGKLG